MWFQKVGVTGEGEFTAEEIEAGFSLIGLDFEVLVTLDDDQTISKQARRYCYNNKLHDRVKKIGAGLVGELSGSAGMLVYFGNLLNPTVDYALAAGVPVVLFPENFQQTLKEGWNQSG